MNYGKPDIRKSTYLIIRKDRKYLSRREILTGRVIWSPELSEAWKTKSRNTAQAVQSVYGGQIMLFNTVIWKVKEYE